MEMEVIRNRLHINVDIDTFRCIDIYFNGYIGIDKIDSLIGINRLLS